MEIKSLLCNIPAGYTASSHFKVFSRLAQTPSSVVLRYYTSHEYTSTCFRHDFGDPTKADHECSVENWCKKMWQVPNSGNAYPSNIEQLNLYQEVTIKTCSRNTLTSWDYIWVGKFCVHSRFHSTNIGRNLESTRKFPTLACVLAGPPHINVNYGL